MCEKCDGLNRKLDVIIERQASAYENFQEIAKLSGALQKAGGVLRDLSEALGSLSQEMLDWKTAHLFASIDVSIRDVKKEIEESL